MWRDRKNGVSTDGACGDGGTAFLQKAKRTYQRKS